MMGLFRRSQKEIAYDEALAELRAVQRDNFNKAKAETELLAENGLRVQALSYAIQESGYFPGIDVVAVAEDYLKFLKGGAA